MKHSTYEELVNYQEILGKAYYENYTRSMSENQKHKLDLLYQDVFNSPSKIKNGCGRCQLDSLRKLGEAFFNYQKELATKLTVPTDVEDEIVVEEKPIEVTQEEIKPKKKAGRPKKNV